MHDDELELAILRRYVEQHAVAAAADPAGSNKCLRELDFRAVLGELTGATGAELTALVRLWRARLVGDKRPLRPCSRRDADHRDHARAYYDPANEPYAPAWDRIRELERAGVTVARKATNAMTDKIRLFISHSSADEDLAEAFIGLFRTALNLSAAQIRCTSVPGCKLPLGADTDEQLRREACEADAFLLLVSRHSVSSPWVLYEAGARWGANRRILPVLSHGTNPKEMGGPLASYSGLRADDHSDLHQIVADIATTLDLRVEAPAVYQKQIEAVAKLRHKAESSGAATDTQIDRLKFVEALRALVSEHVHVNLRFAHVHQRGFADTLVGAFELAGWQTSLTVVPLDRTVNDAGYFDGAQVVGFNPILVTAVADALRGIGIADVRTRVSPLRIKSGNPKRGWVSRRIKVTLGHDDVTDPPFELAQLDEALREAGLPHDGISSPQAAPAPDTDTNPTEYLPLSDGRYVRLTLPAGRALTRAQREIAEEIVGTHDADLIDRFPRRPEHV